VGHVTYTVLRELDISDLEESEFTLLAKDGFFGKALNFILM
jgi:hypothetical protein